MNGSEDRGPPANPVTDRQVEDLPEPFDGEEVAGAEEPLPSLPRPPLSPLPSFPPAPLAEPLVSDDPAAGVVDAGVVDESEPDPEGSDDPPSDLAAGTAESPEAEVELPDRLSVL